MIDEQMRSDYLAAHAWLVSAGLASNDGREHTVAERVKKLIIVYKAAQAWLKSRGHWTGRECDLLRAVVMAEVTTPPVPSGEEEA